MDDTRWRDTDDATSPKYNRPVVAQAILEAAVEIHPRLLTTRELSLRIIADPEDRREVGQPRRQSMTSDSQAYSQTETTK